MDNVRQQESQSQMAYLHIPNLYSSQDILLFRECFALEKIHGSSSHISWDGQAVKFFAGGCKHDQFVNLFNVDKLTELFTAQFGDSKVVIFGEGYGGKLQGMSHTYGADLKFIAFEVKVGDLWLNVPKAEAIAHNLGLEFVHYDRVYTDIDTLNCIRDTDSVQAIRNGLGNGHKQEGVVLRPLEEFTKNNGDRVICKHKRDDFAERKTTPKVGAPKEVLIRANQIVEEWVLPMRLEHLLDKNPQITGMEHTGQLIKAMVEDVYREAQGEIVEGKEVVAAIGRQTALMWKEKLKKNLLT